MMVTARVFENYAISPIFYSGRGKINISPMSESRIRLIQYMKNRAIHFGRLVITNTLTVLGVSNANKNECMRVRIGNLKPPHAPSRYQP